MLARGYFLHLLHYLVVQRLSLFLGYVLPEVFELLPCLLGLLLIGLMLFYLLDNVFYLLVALLYQPFGLALGLADDLLALFFQSLRCFLVVADGRFEGLLVLMYLLPLAFPVSLVSHNVLQVLVALDVIRAHYLAGILDNLLRKTGLAGYLYGKRAAGLTYGKLKEGAHLLAVVEHGTVNHHGVGIGIMLQVLIMGGNDAPRLVFAKLLEHALGYGAAYLRLCSGAKLIY